MNTEMIIRQSSSSDLEILLTVERAAFGSEEEAELVQNLLNDPTAEPRLSLLALQEHKAVCHIRFSMEDPFCWVSAIRPGDSGWARSSWKA